jgi:hypothetical protein
MDFVHGQYIMEYLCHKQNNKKGGKWNFMLMSTAMFQVWMNKLVTKGGNKNDVEQGAEKKTYSGKY